MVVEGGTGETLEVVPLGKVEAGRRIEILFLQFMSEHAHIES